MKIQDNIIKKIANIILYKIDNKIDRLEKKYNIWIHTCNITEIWKYKDKKYTIGVTYFSPSNTSGESNYSSYDIIINDFSIYLFKTNYYYKYDEYEIIPNEYIDIINNICNLLNKK